MIRAFRVWLSKPIHFAALLFALSPLTVLFRWMWFNGRNVPRFDQWRGYPIVFNAQDGTLTFRDFLTPTGDQITFFSHLQTAIFTWLTDWNLWAEMWVNLALAIIIFALYVLLFNRHTRGAVAYVLLPFSLILFMLRQDANWTNGYMSAWWYPQLWWLAALTLFAYKPNKIGWAILAGVFGFFATISQAVGVVTWAAVVVYLILRPGWAWRSLGVWLVMGIGSVGYYISLAPASTENASSGFVVWLQAFVYALAQVGVVFEAFSNIPFLVAVGGVGLLILLANAVYLLWRGERDLVALWLSIAAYALAAAYLIGVGRIPQDGFQRVFFTWYTTGVIPFWLAWVALAIAAGWQSKSDNGRWGRVLLYINILAGAILAMLYVPSNDNALNKILATQWRGVQESCVMRYIFVQDEIPFCYLQETPEIYEYNLLAARRLALFAGREPESILHDGATDDDPILIETHTPWLNTHIRNYFLDGVDRDRLYHVFPDMPEVLAEIPNPPNQNFTDFSESGVDALLAQLGDVESFWYIRRDDYVSAIPAFWDALAQRDYLVLDTRQRNDGMLVSRVQRVPATLENSPVFGEMLRLRAVSDVSETVSACEALTLNTFWRAEMNAPVDYSVSLRLLDMNGEKVAQSDSGLGIVGTSQWDSEQLYADERTLTIPCELPAGDYQLYLAVYYYQAPDAFLAVAGGESPESTMLFIRQIEVQD